MTERGRFKVALLGGVLALGTGCDSGMRAKVPAMPAAPATAAHEPLILPQTVAVLPSAQPVPPEAVPPRVPADAVPGGATEPVIQAPRHIPPVRTKLPERPSGPAAVAPAPPEPAREEPAGPLLSGEDLVRSNARIESRLAELRRRLRPFAASSNSGTKTAASRIGSFLRLADQERKRGDLRQADAMADRAETLLQELSRR